MSVSEFTRDQLIELKQSYLCRHLDECEDRSPSYGELADADELVSDDTIYENYGGYDFSSDDFFCTAG
ncbi:MAG: hypothetical protein J5965_04655 [Aeriscardovia sp.]|nr:hypothetical protein [Aeriscardovia sp.]